jgi:hypothetical protein
MIDIPCYTQESVERVFQMNDSMLHMFCEQIFNNSLPRHFVPSYLILYVGKKHALFYNIQNLFFF